MSSGITLTAATRQNLLSLQGTADLLTQTQNRLSTGKKVNSALDDPTSFFTSQALSGRSGDLGSLLNGISNGVQTIQAANQGITSIQKLVDSAKSTANQALADKSVASTGKAAAAATLTASTSFQGTSTANKTVGGVSTGTQDFSTFGDASFSVSVDGGTTSTSIKIDRSTLSSVASDLTNVTAENIATVINNQITNTPSLSGKVSASVGSDGRLSLSTTATGGSAKIQVTTAAGTTKDIGFGKDALAKPNANTAANAIASTLSFAPVGASTTGASAITTVALDGTKTAGFDVTDSNGKTTNVRLSATSTTDGTTTFAAATAVTKTELLSAINYQLSQDKSDVIATYDASDQLVLTSKTGGISSKADVNGVATTGTAQNIGFGTTAVTNVGTRAQGADSGSASFTVNDGVNPAKTIKLDSKTLYDGTNALGTSATKENVVKAIQSALQQNGLALTASLDSAGKLSIASTNYGTDSPTISFKNGASVGGVDLGFGTAADVSATNGSGSAQGSATVAGSALGSDAVNGGTVNTTRQALAKQFNELRQQITQLAKDASYNGINLLYRSGSDPAENTLKVTFNESGSSSLSIAGTKIDSDGLGLNATTGDFQTDDEINKTLTAITAATSQLRLQSSTFGSNLSVVQNRQDFSKNLINILDTGSANLTNADLNEEAANSQALSTRQSIGISALSLANTAQQGILQLLR